MFGCSAEPLWHNMATAFLWWGWISTLKWSSLWNLIIVISSCHGFKQPNSLPAKYTWVDMRSCFQPFPLRDDLFLISQLSWWSSMDERGIIGHFLPNKLLSCLMRRGWSIFWKFDKTIYWMRWHIKGATLRENRIWRRGDWNTKGFAAVGQNLRSISWLLIFIWQTLLLTLSSSAQD